jgi:hypothetical protein
MASQNTHNGATSPQQHRVGEHWSGTNPVPTIQKFMERLNREEKEQKEYEEAQTARERQTEGGASPHQPRKKTKGKTRRVRDPVTGKDMEVEDMDEHSMDTIKDPKVTRSTSCDAKWNFC